jgi:uncharacterized protein DUF2017
MFDDPFRLLDNGTIEVRLSEPEAAAVKRVASDILDELNSAEDPGLRRLFPPAYEKEPELEEEFRRFTHDDLVGHKRETASAVIESINGGKRKRGAWTGKLDQETAHAWLTMLNDARLILGTRLDVTEEMEHTPLPESDPRSTDHNIYLYLSSLQWALLEALMMGLPDTGTE